MGSFVTSGILADVRPQYDGRMFHRYPGWSSLVATLVVGSVVTVGRVALADLTRGVPVRGYVREEPPPSAWGSVDAWTNGAGVGWAVGVVTGFVLFVWFSTADGQPHADGPNDD